MAPDSKLWHRLGEAGFYLRKSFLKAAVPACLLLSISSGNIEARTETFGESMSKGSNTFVSYERLLVNESMNISALFLPAPSVFPSPAVRWSNRNQIPIPNQPAVQKYIRYFKGEGRLTFMSALERSLPYAPVMADIMEANGVPAELLAVVFIESGFRRHASNAGAKGYWQLLAGTARTLGLRVDHAVDERLDPVKSTQAASAYLRSFYERYHSWPLALASYNSGGGPVKNALRGRECDFWELSKSRCLPGHTLNFVPKVLAAAEIIRDLESYGFKRPKSFPLYDFETIRVQAPLQLDQVAAWLDVPVSQMKELNPSLCTDKVPPRCDFNLRLPSGSRDKFDLAYQKHLEG